MGAEGRGHASPLYCHGLPSFLLPPSCLVSQPTIQLTCLLPLRLSLGQTLGSSALLGRAEPPHSLLLKSPS